MLALVTAGPTYEPLDAVRRLTNFSTGRLGGELANFLAGRGYGVTLLLGETAVWAGPFQARETTRFTTGQNLFAHFQRLASTSFDLVCHAAAVADFSFGRVWERPPSGDPVPVRAGKVSSQAGSLLAELTPTPKLILKLRDLFPRAWIAGWKYEVDGRRRQAVAKALAQLQASHTDACVANGPAYGAGFGLVTADGQHRHLRDRRELYRALDEMARLGRRPATSG
jgi:phosphopantothenoylcysteine decarboxylase/phosphopantothenate--cysteine ligase